MKVNRELLLSELEPILPGLSPREIIEQSSCIVFKDGNAITFNDEIACSHKTSLEDLKGAVRAEPLISLLRKLNEETVEVEAQKGELVVKGNRKEAAIAMEEEIMLPIETLEKPREWKKIPEGFSEAVDLAQQCAGKDETQFISTCVHIHPDWIEACDNWQLIRCPIKTNVGGSCLVRQASIKHVVAMGFTRFAETDAWIHFRNKSGLTMSCRRHLDEYMDMNPFLKLDNGKPMTLPKGLGDAVEKAEIFSSENTDNNLIAVELRQGKLRIKSVGLSGRYKEVKKLNYQGEELKFYIAPKLLTEICKRYNDCEVNGRRLKVEGGNFTFVACLTVPDDE